MNAANVQIKKDWKFYTGCVFLVLAFTMPLFGFAVPFLKLPHSISIPLITLLTVGGPEIMIILAAVFLGKQAYNYFREKIFSFFKKTIRPQFVSKTRYYIGIVLFLASPIPLYLNAYVPQVMPEAELHRYLILICADFIFVLSFFILGGNFWEKIKRIFIWQDEYSSKI